MDNLALLSLFTSAAALLGLVLVQGWQVIARYVLNDSPSWTEPVTVLLLSITLGLGAAACVHERRHFSFALLTDTLPATLRRGLRVICDLTIVLTGAVLAWWGWALFSDGLHIPTAGAPLPQSIGYLPLAVGGALMMLFAGRQLLLTLRHSQGAR
jgi:TRAP-type C4-dicarboxylate transport system permease small subunit